MRDPIGRASRAAGLPLYSPHDLRHRRGSLWHAEGMPARELAERMGHSKASMSLDVYTHVMPDEVSEERVLASSMPSVSLPVWPGCGLEDAGGPQNRMG
jgi:integrase